MANAPIARRRWRRDIDREDPLRTVRDDGAAEDVLEPHISPKSNRINVVLVAVTVPVNIGNHIDD
ncbi:MAG: hypothetical protein MK085_02535, partial [Phycisphaerales bacterium]|nr:hypothetical protein [Phycisphaerales bacterium]